MALPSLLLLAWTLGLISGWIDPIKAETTLGNQVGSVSIWKTERDAQAPSEKWDDVYEYASISGVAAMLSIYFLLLIIIPPSLVLTMLLDQEKFQLKEQQAHAQETERAIQRSSARWNRPDHGDRHTREVTTTTNTGVSTWTRVLSWARFGASVFIIGIPIAFFASSIFVIGLVTIPYEEHEEEEKEMEHPIMPPHPPPIESHEREFPTAQAQQPQARRPPHHAQALWRSKRKRIQNARNPNVNYSQQKSLWETLLAWLPH